METGRNIKKFGLLSAFVVVALMAAGSANADEMSLTDFASETGASVQYDPFLEMGRLRHAGKSVRFAVGSDEMITDDGRKLTVSPPEHRDGTVYFDENTISSLRSVWRPKATDREEPYVAAIFIDPGHGGRDPGTIGRHQVDGETRILQEKDIVLTTALMVRDLLSNNYEDRNIVLSREDDRYLSLEERTEMANEIPLGENEYIVYLSIHANASLNTRATGFEAWFLPPEERRTLIRPEDLDEDRRSIHAVLNSMREEEVSVHSAMLGNAILEELDVAVGDRSPNRGLKQESWAVVRNALMPSILVELGFVTNAAEAQMLDSQDYLHRLARGIYNGITDFIERFENPDTGGA